MIRLSRAGWNNVLIFSTLIMIMLLNGLHKNLWDDPELLAATLLDDKSFALTINYTASSVNSPSYRLERAGREWRFMADSAPTSSKAALSPLNAADIIQQWKTSAFPLIDETLALHHLKHQEPVQVASVWVAGEANPRTYQLLLPERTMPHVYIKAPSYLEENEFFWFEIPREQVTLLGFMHE